MYEWVRYKPSMKIYEALKGFQSDKYAVHPVESFHQVASLMSHQYGKRIVPDGHLVRGLYFKAGTAACSGCTSLATRKRANGRTASQIDRRYLFISAALANLWLSSEQSSTVCCPLCSAAPNRTMVVSGLEALKINVNKNNKIGIRFLNGLSYQDLAV